MVQSRVLCQENVTTFHRIAVDEVEMMVAEKELPRLAKMQEIDLSYAAIHTDRFGYLDSLNLGVFCSLCKLDLSHNQLMELPKSIGSLPSLTHLFLNDNRLFLPQPIIVRQLANLQELDLRNNKLIDFSLDITELSCLFTPMFIGMNPLSFDGFCSLRKLDLSHNQLDKLSESIGSLLSLTHLFLNDNNLSSLQPIIIRRLVNLQELDLRNNKLNNFSLDITELSCLRRLSVQGNPLKDDETRKLMKLAHNERWIDIAGECKILFLKVVDYHTVKLLHNGPLGILGGRP